MHAVIIRVIPIQLLLNSCSVHSCFARMPRWGPFHIQICVIPWIRAIYKLVYVLRMLYKTVEAGEIVSYTPQDYQPWRHSLCFSCALSLLFPRPNCRMMTTLAFLLKQSKNKWDCRHPPWLVCKRNPAKKSASLPHTSITTSIHTSMFVRVELMLKVNRACMHASCWFCHSGACIIIIDLVYMHICYTPYVSLTKINILTM